MSQAWVGKCLIQKSANGKILTSIRILCVEAIHDKVIYIELPKTKKGRQSHYLSSLKVTSMVELAKKINADSGHQLVDFNVPEHWLYTDLQLSGQAISPLLRRQRKKLDRWKEVRDASFELIRPFVDGRSVCDLVNDPEIFNWPSQRAVELGLRSKAKIERALRAFLMGMADKRALMPNYINCGAPGTEKFSVKDTGRPSIAASQLGQKRSKPNLSAETRSKLAIGYRKYKARGVSDKVALARTLNDYFAKSARPTKGGLKIELKPEAWDITPRMFKYWGTKNKTALRSIDYLRNMSPNRDEILRRISKSTDKFSTLNGVAYLDSTSTDQTLISSVNPLKRLKSPWRTEVLGASIDYIFGVYVGFEAASATTALLSILNAATDKVAFCARYGHEIEPRDWLSCTFSTIQTDNGEAKGQLAMYTLEQLSTSMVFGKSYDAINKSASESGHRKRQADNDHLMPGSSMGRQKARGEKDRFSLAGLKFEDYMHELIAAILHHNNVAYIDPPRIEMYAGIKERTRRGVVEWMMEHHYLSSAATDIDFLRVMCLPRFEAVLHGDGIHVFAPGSNRTKLIKHLVYRSPYLLESDLLHEHRGRSKSLEVHLNPMDISHVWANIKGLKRFDLASGDKDLHLLTLVDWIGISEDNKLAKYLADRVELQHLAAKLNSIDQANKKGKKEKTAASQEHGSLNKKQKGGDVRSTTEAEKTLHTGMPPRANVVPYMDAMMEKNNQKTEKKSPKLQVKPTSYDDMLFDDIAKIYRRQPGDGNG
jgi:hypothetical protein